MAPQLPAVQGPLDGPARRWDRLLWGVQFTGSRTDDEPMLIGGLWAPDLGGNPYPGEPTRALLFCTRKQARAWCADTLRKWRDGRQRDDIVTRWMVRPVRVRETVEVEALTAEVSGCLRAPMPEDAPRTAAGIPLDRPVGPVAGA